MHNDLIEDDSFVFYIIKNIKERALQDRLSESSLFGISQWLISFPYLFHVKYKHLLLLELFWLVCGHTTLYRMSSGESLAQLTLIPVSNALYYAVLCVLESPGYLAWHMDTLKRALPGHCFIKCQTNIFSSTAHAVQLPNSEMRDSESRHNQVWYICLWVDFYQWKQLQLAFN